MDIMTVILDQEMAEMWIRHALKEKTGEAYFNVGLLYLEGRGVEIDLEEAMTWFQLAAAMGDIEAINNVAALYARKKDYRNAARWFQKAADKHDQVAMRNLERCNSILKQEKTNEGELNG